MADVLTRDFEALKRAGAEQDIKIEADSITLPSLTARRLIREASGLNQGQVARFVDPQYTRAACGLWETSNVAPQGAKKVRYYWLLTRLLVEVLEKEKARLEDMNRRYVSLFERLDQMEAEKPHADETAKQ